MNVKTRFTLFLICALVLLCGQAKADSDRSLKIASFPIPPLLHESVNGTFSGTMGETVKVLCEEAKINCTFQIVPLKRAYRYLEQNHVDSLITLNAGQFNDCCIPSQWMSPWAAGFFANKSLDPIPQTPTDTLGHSLIVVNGMRSPYLFIPELEKWAKEKKVKLSVAKDIYSATRMFANERAGLLWGSDDFNWYFDKIGTSAKTNFLPLIVKPVVVWVRKEKQPLLAELNKAYRSLIDQNKLDRKNLLIPELMRRRYIDAPFNYNH